MKFAVIQFPGSNCDRDCLHVIRNVFQHDGNLVWHMDRDLSSYDCIVLPGGFSYGDYLRCGAIARFSPVMNSVVEAARQGKLVIGICNGFQILTEAGLLPGALMVNKNLGFICEFVELEVTNVNTPFSNQYQLGQTIKIPIAHGEGNYQADALTVEKLEKNNQVVFRYVHNPNGSINNIAGIINEKGNVIGMMPHPERCSEAILNGTDGAGVFKSIFNFLSKCQKACYV
jgi:phosphoribosylformylglycinamidine synthase